MSPYAPPGGGRLSAPIPLSPDHDRSRFDCGKPELDDWLHRTAAASEGRTARTYVTCAGNRIVGYYALAAGNTVRAALPSARLRRNTPADVPVLVIARLAVDREFHGRRIGRGLLKDALLRAVEASRAIGIRAVVVHAIDDEAARFYRRYGFLPSPMDPRTLVLPIETAVSGLPS